MAHLTPIDGCDPFPAVTVAVAIPAGALAFGSKKALSGARLMLGSVLKAVERTIASGLTSEFKVQSLKQLQELQGKILAGLEGAPGQ